MIRLPFAKPKEKFLILEITPRRTEGLLLSIDLEKNIKLEKFWDSFSIKNISKRLRHNLEKWKIIISADPSLAYTTMVSIQMDRDEDRWKVPISKIEIENLLSGATAKVFSHCRKEASAALGINELDTVLINNRVNSFKVDGHQVINPVDFNARKIDAILELTLTTRDIFEEWKSFFSIGQRQNFFFTESARAELAVLNKIKSFPVNLVMFRPESTHYFCLETANIGNSIRRGKIKWQVYSILEKVATSWGVDFKVAQNVYENYLNENLSPGVSRFFENHFKGIVNNFFGLLVKANLKGPVYVETCLALPVKLPKKQGKLVFHDLPTDLALSKLGFKIDAGSWRFESNRTFRHLAPFLEFYYNSKDIPINHWLRRRLHWLGSAS